MFTATVTSFFLEPTRKVDEGASIEARLARIESTLEVLMRGLEAGRVDDVERW